MVDRSQIEAKARELESAFDETKQGARNAAVVIGIGVLAVIIITFLLGRRRGKKKVGAVIEVYKL